MSKLKTTEVVKVILTEENMIDALEQMLLNQGLISTECYDKNADALSHIADSSSEVPEIIEALSVEYLRLNKA